MRNEIGRPPFGLSDDIYFVGGQVSEGDFGLPAAAEKVAFAAERKPLREDELEFASPDAGADLDVAKAGFFVEFACERFLRSLVRLSAAAWSGPVSQDGRISWIEWGGILTAEQKHFTGVVKDDAAGGWAGIDHGLRGPRGVLSGVEGEMQSQLNVENQTGADGTQSVPAKLGESYCLNLGCWWAVTSSRLDQCRVSMDKSLIIVPLEAGMLCQLA